MSGMSGSVTQFAAGDHARPTAAMQADERQWRAHAREAIAARPRLPAQAGPGAGRGLTLLADRANTCLSQLRAELGLDAGYLSRLLRRLREAGLLQAKDSPDDARVSWLRLTARGRRAVQRLDAASQAQVTQLIDGLPSPSRQQLIGAMDTVRLLMSSAAPRTPPAAPAAPAASDAVTLDEPGPGDLGWVVQRHGALYAQEHGWDARFEALVARIVADFVDQRQPARERAWIARRDGVNLGCIFLVQAAPAEHGQNVAQLRLLLVEPAARGLGLGDRLVGECERFAAAAGYRRMVLWTNSSLHASRALYQRHGWQLENEEPHHSFGHDLVGQMWGKPLRAGGQIDHCCLFPSLLDPGRAAMR